MVVVDACSREPISKPFESPDEIDPYFPEVPEMTGNIRLPTGQLLEHALHNTTSESEPEKEVNFIQATTLPRSLVTDLNGLVDDDGYDGDSDRLGRVITLRPISDYNYISAPLSSPFTIPGVTEDVFST